MIHKEYSYLNCKFECFLNYSQSEVYKKHNSNCLPWYFPTADDYVTACDPWESYDFLQIMSNEIPDNNCPMCLPDCNVTIYEPTINSIPFDSCDYRNLGVSRFCSFNEKRPHPMTDKFITQVQNENNFQYNSKYNFTLFFNLQNITTTNRTHAATIPTGDVFKLIPKYYDAFDRDIAMVNRIFQKSTAVLMGSQNSMTWIDYFATVGGLLGLVLGMGFISFVELFWLCLRIVSRQCDLTEFIP